MPRNVAAGVVAAGIFSDLVLRYLTRKRSKSASVRIDERDILVSRRSSEGAIFVLAVSALFFYALERGRYVPSLALAFRIARVFDLPLEQVFRYEP
jgi:putative transcriptional regulator